MNADAFVVTNVLICAAAGHRDAPEKHARAREIIGPGESGISSQVLAGFHVNVLRRPAVPLTHAEAAAWLADLQVVPIVPVDGTLVAEAADRSQRHRISCWGAATLVAAERLGAATLCSEELDAGQSYGTVTVINPFRAA